MWQTPKILEFSPQFLHPPSTSLLHQTTTPSLPTLKQHSKISRRELAVHTSSLLLLLGSQTLDPPHHSKANAQESPRIADRIDAQEDAKKSSVVSSRCDDKTPTQRAFLDISIDGQPIGRIIVGLYGNSSTFGAARFSRLVSGAAGVSYRRKEFTKIMPDYVQHGGVRSYGVDAELANRTGATLAAERLIQEWERGVEECPSKTKNLARSLSIIVRDPSRPPPKVKLVARKGRLEIDQEEVKAAPNGTEFVITVKDSPELDASALVVGEVLEGMDVVERIVKVKTVQDNTGSPYFRVAKLIGDKRAVVAERGFNRPYSKVLITNCGLME